MGEVWLLASSFPSVVFTVPLGVMLVYWTFVMVGAIDLGEGADGALDGLDAGGVDGAAKGALEGATKGLLEAGLHGATGADGGFDVGDAGGDVGDVGDGGDGGDAGDGDGHAEVGHGAGVVASLLSALRLRQIPATAALSLIVTFSWLISVVAMQALTRMHAGLGASWLGWVVLVSAPVFALPLSGLISRPLSKVFVHRTAPSRADLVGKTCIVRTGKVTSTFGEGMLEDGGAGLVVRLRIDGNRELKRGEHVLIVDWDAEREAFVVEPMADVLALRK